MTPCMLIPRKRINVLKQERAIKTRSKDNISNSAWCLPPLSCTLDDNKPHDDNIPLWCNKEKVGMDLLQTSQMKTFMVMPHKNVSLESVLAISFSDYIFKENYHHQIYKYSHIFKIREIIYEYKIGHKRNKILYNI